MAKNPPASAGDTGSIPGSGRSPREGNGNPLRYSCLENSMDRGAWWITVHEVRHDSDGACTLKKKKKDGRRKGEKEDRKKADRKKERKEERREEGQEERKKMVNLGQYLWALTFQTRCYTDIKIHTMLDIMHLHFTLKEN